MKFSDINNLDFNNAGSWPPLAKAIAVIMIIAVVAGLGFWYDTRSQLDTLESASTTERQLRQEFIDRQRVMANIDAYRAQLDTMQTTLNAMIRQLPTRTEMPDLLEDISNTGRRNGLNFELFKPEDEQPREFYAAKPISIKAHASYHQFGAFISSIAALSRIVTLESAALTELQQQQATSGGRPVAASKPGDTSKTLLIEATLQTYRYLEEDETNSSPEQRAGKNARPPKQ
jgi:type IV pilus assembly protein PilO